MTHLFGVSPHGTLPQTKLQRNLTDIGENKQ